VGASIDSTAVARVASLANSGRYADMQAVATELVRAHPNSGFAWKALGVSLQMQQKDALRELERAAALLPSDADCHSNLGAALRRLGRLKDAVACFRRALEIKPGASELWNNLGNAQKDLGQFDDAIACYRRALDLRPSFAQPFNNLGNALLSAGKLDDAVTSYRRAIALQPGYIDAHVNLGIVLRLKNCTLHAEESCQRALELDSKSAAALRLMAELRSDHGEFSAAEQLYGQAIAIEPESAESWAGIAGLRRMTLEDSAWLEAAQRIVARSPAASELYLRYALGKYFDDVGAYEQAFENYRRANELTAQRRPPHDRRLLALGIDGVMARHDKEWLAGVSAVATSSVRPVFVVGLPRSGTTLAEQILASHVAVFGAGELPYWNAAAEMCAEAHDGGEVELSSLRSAAEAYLALLATLSADAPRVVNKMPANFLHLGVIHAALPAAKFIHLCRNPIDTCLSIYFQNFGAVHPYANDLEDLADYYRQYRRLMEHWRQTLPSNAILDVPYEGLVEDTEGWSRRMLEFIGLPWDRACLEFHKSGRTVNTFSKWQARQKISRSSIERWRHYEKFVGPLRELTEDRFTS
jgi:tetratricopeptide (TPR) repeat protein